MLMLCCTVLSHAVSEHAACAWIDTHAGCLQQQGHWCAERDALPKMAKLKLLMLRQAIGGTHSINKQHTFDA